MRVTRNMMIESAAYWNTKQLERLNDISTIVASGNRVNTASDDPSDYARILKDRTTISQYAQYESNISLAQTWVEANNTTMEAIYSLLGDAEDILTTASVSSTDDADELSSIYEQLLDYVNSTDSSSNYLYSGTDSVTAPFSNTVDVSSGTAGAVVFDLAAAASTVTITITDASGETVRTLTVSGGGTAGTNTVAWDGTNDSGVTVDDGSYSYTVAATDSSGDAVASYPTYQGNTEGKTVAIGKDSIVTFNTDGGAIFGSAIKVLSEAITALQNSDYDASDQESLLSSLTSAKSDVENAIISLSNKNTQLENADDRLAALSTTLSSQLSDLQLADDSLTSAELETQQTNYEEATAALAKIMDMSKLTDYLS